MLNRLPSLALLLIATACTTSDDVESGDDDVATPDGVDVDDVTEVDDALAAGERCDDAQTITLPGDAGFSRIFSSTELSADDYDIAACPHYSGSPGPDRVFLVNVAAGHRLIATVKSVSNTQDPAVYLVRGSPAACADATLACLAAANLVGQGDYERVAYENDDATAIDVYIIVDGVGAQGGAFRLDVQVDPIPPTPPGDTCALAEPVTWVNGAATVRGTTSLYPGYDNTYVPGCTHRKELGNDRVYRVKVPAGQRLETMLTPTFTAALYVLASEATTCSATCLAGDAGLPGQPAVIAYENASASSVDVFVVVDSYRELFGGDYRLDLQLTALP
jgi:hypothetical protein